MKRRPSSSLIISITLHIVLGGALLWVLSIPYPFQSFLQRKKVESMPVERISFLTLPDRGTNTPGRAGGDGRPVTPKGPAPPLRAPTQIPSAVPTPPPAAPQPTQGGKGPVVGREGLREGITPSFSDPRLWLPPGPVVSAPKSPAERVDSTITAEIRRYRDSLAAVAANAGRAPGDWTFEKGGKKYGIDSQKIYIGDISIPTAILALLPLNSGGNPISVDRERALAYQRSDINFQAQRAMNEDEFREAVKRIRLRKERERQDEIKHREEQKKKAEKTISEP